MTSYILFVFANFQDHEEIEFFCIDHFSSIAETGIKYVIEDNGNCIIIFDTSKDKKELFIEIKNLLTIDQVRFYFFFEMGSILTSHVPTSIKDFIFKPITEAVAKLKITVETNQEMDLDDILDKIQKKGVKGLTTEEKDFLDRFGK